MKERTTLVAKITVFNKKFARDKGEQLVQGVWSDFENALSVAT